MRDFVTIVFDNAGDAYKGLHALWALDDEGGITVHGTAVVHRDSAGRFEVDTKETQPILATAVGAGIGALLGALAGPVGLAIGATTGSLIGAPPIWSVRILASRPLWRADSFSAGVSPP